MSVLKGDLSTFGLPELFQHLSQNKKYGILRIYHSSKEKKLIFQPNGITLLTAGDRKSKEIGKLLVFHRFISLAQLDQALNFQKQAKTRTILGQALIELGYVSKENVTRIMLDQIKEEIYDLFTWEKADFEFIEDLGEVEKLNLNPNLIIDKENIAGTILEALQRIDEWEIIREDIPPMSSIYVPSNVYLEDLLNMHSEEALRQVLNSQPTDNSANMQVFALVDGRNTIADVVEKSYMPRFEVFIEICNLVRQDYIRPATPYELVTIVQSNPAQSKGDKAKIYAFAYPHCYLDQTQANCTLEILKFFQENPTLHIQFPMDLKAEILRMSKVYLNANEIESSRYMLKVNLPQFGNDDEYRLLYLEILAKLGESEEALNIIYPIAKKFKEAGEFRKLNQYCTLAKQFNNEHPVFKKIKALKSSPEKNPKRIFSLISIIVFFALGFTYYHFYTQAQKDSLVLLNNLQKKSNVTQDFRKQLKDAFGSKNYQLATKYFRELQQNQSFLKQIEVQIEEFSSSKSIFFVGSHFADFLSELAVQQKNLVSQLKQFQITINEERIKLIVEFTELLKKGRWEEFSKQMRHSESLFSDIVRYKLKPKPKLEGYKKTDQEIPETLKEGLPKLFAQANATLYNQGKAEEILKEAKKHWDNAVRFKSYNFFAKCLKSYQELYHKIAETDIHRKSMVPLLISPVFDEETEPKLAKLQGIPKSLKIELTNANLEQTINFKEKGEAFLCTYTLPIRLLPNKPDITLELTLPGFEPLKETIFTNALNRLSYNYTLRRVHSTLAFPQVTHLISYKDLLILVSRKENDNNQIQAIDLEGNEKWRFPFSGKLISPPTIYNDLMFIGATSTTLGNELVNAECTLYDLGSVSGIPEEIATTQIPGGLHSQAIFFQEQNLICFTGVKLKNRRRNGCIYFLSMENLKEVKEPMINTKESKLTGLVHNSNDSIFYGAKQEYYSYSVKNQRNNWFNRRRIKDKSASFQFTPFINSGSVAFILGTKKTTYLLCYDLENGKEFRSLDLRKPIVNVPTLNNKIIAITTERELFTFDLSANFITNATYSCPQKIASSAISDGIDTFFYTEAGEVFAIDSKGDLSWRYLLRKQQNSRDYTSITGNPTIFAGHLILPFKEHLILFDLGHKKTK